MPEQCQYLEEEPAGYDIAFESGHEICHGVHYLPACKDPVTALDERPCVILAHGFGGTVEAGLHPYARAFARSGLHAVVFDYRHFGRSGGTPRQLVSIRRQLQDWHAAIAFVRSQKGIDTHRIVLWGVSLSGGHVIHVAARDRHVCAVVAQFPMLDGFAALRNIISYAGYRQILRLIYAGIRDLTGRMFGRQATMIPIVGPPGELAALSTPDAEPGYRAIADPAWRNEVCARIALAIPFYRPGLLLERITSPVLIQIADHDAILPLASIECLVQPAHPCVQIRHYSSGHFDAFYGEQFNSAVNDQLNFIWTALSENS